MRVIDADDLSERVPWIVSRIMKHNLDLAPTIDAVPVVRCGECRRYDSELYVCSKCGVCVNRDFYCADGEKEG